MLLQGKKKRGREIMDCSSNVIIAIMRQLNLKEIKIDKYDYYIGDDKEYIEIYHDLKNNEVILKRKEVEK